MENEKYQELVLQQLKMLTEGQESIGQAVARIEHEHGEKLSALFDGYKLLSETLSDHTARLERIEEKVTSHDIKIEILDKTKAAKRRAK
ncbi:MAG: hypothetical protein ACYC2T_10450 [Bacillota bacterium]